MWRSFPYHFIFMWLCHFQGLIYITEAVFPGCAYISEWSMCSSSCGTGMRIRALNCTMNKGTWYKMKKCINYHFACYIKPKNAEPKTTAEELNDDIKTSSDNCMGSNCHGYWSQWTRCSSKCGNGLQTRVWIDNKRETVTITPLFDKRFCIHWDKMCSPSYVTKQEINITAVEDVEELENASRIRNGVIIGVVLLLIIFVFVAMILLKFR